MASEEEDMFPRGHKASLRYLPIIFKLSCLGKTYKRCLRDNLTATICKRAQKCLGKTSNRCLNKMST